MIDGGKLVGDAYKGFRFFKDRKNRSKCRIEDDLRRTTRANAGNCLTAEIGCEKDRLYSKRVAKGMLTRTPLGYMLPEYGNWGGSRFQSRFQRRDA